MAYYEKVTIARCSQCGYEAPARSRWREVSGADSYHATIGQGCSRFPILHHEVRHTVQASQASWLSLQCLPGVYPVLERGSGSYLIRPVSRQDEE